MSTGTPSKVRVGKEPYPTSALKMAATSVNIYVDNGMYMFLDPLKTTPFPGPLYQRAGDPLSYYMDKALSVKVRMLQLSELNHPPEESSVLVDAERCPSPALTVKLDGFSREHTLFLIDLMRQHLADDSGPPRDLAELVARLKRKKGSKRLLWQDAAEKLEARFKASFCPDRVARKWGTLVEAYKKIKDSNRSAETGRMRFKYYKEMDELMGGEDDTALSDNEGSADLDVCRPEEKVENHAEPTGTATSPEPAVAKNDGFSRKHTLFLIDLMRRHLADDSGPPRDLAELNARLKTTKGSKKKLWQEAAEKLEAHFKASFCPDRVSRKWGTLVDGYKKAKDDRSAGKETTRFKYLREMEELVGAQDDVVLSEVGSCRGLLGQDDDNKTPRGAATEQRDRLTSPTDSRKRKRAVDEEDILDMFRQSEEASQRRHQETLEQLRAAQEDFRSAQQSFESLMNQLLKKL
ncbi:uncharacterized protein LOC105926371 [Fundulus heteroclitus]|uniref:uncharacterized protein LOC105926371 n=1 Tax=Fundulus heteroclitus TaxID=8078 RepID=UPI00165A5D78|nr:uncharacterized protein LOC105926371 [Fundulus heteroclitus]